MASRMARGGHWRRARARAAALLTCLHLPAVDSAMAQAPGAVTVVVERRVLMTPDLTPAEARRRAIDEALAEAARRVAGVRVQASTLSATAEDRRGVAGHYHSVVLLDVAARATDYRVEHEEWETLRPAGSDAQLYLRLRLLATVERDEGEADPAFTMELSLNGDRFAVQPPGDAPRDEVVATVRTSHRAYVTLFVVADDSIERLFPNDYVREVEVTPAAPVELPGAEWRERGLHLRPSLPEGRRGRRELLLAVGTRTPPPPAPRRGSLMELQRWLLRIPRPTRTVAFVAYETVRQRE